MSCAAPPPLLATFMLLKTASFALHLPANELRGAALFWQYSISLGVKLRSMNVSFSMLKLSMSSISTPTLEFLVCSWDANWETVSYRVLLFSADTVFLDRAMKLLGIEEYGAELLVGVRSICLGDEEGVVDHAIVEEAVSLLLPGLNLRAVGAVGSLIESSEEVLGVDTNGLCALLTETEGRDRESLDSICLDAAAWVYDVVELLHDLVDIVGVAVARHQTCVEHLQTAVHHPSTSSTLGVTGKVLLENTENSIALLATQVFELLADDRGLVLVVGLGRSTVERCHVEVINGKTPCGQGSTEGSNARILFPEVVTEATKYLLLLSLGLLLDMLSTVGSVRLLIEVLALRLHGFNLFSEILELVRGPLLDLPLAKLDLAPPVLDVKQRRRVLAGVFTSSSQHTLARCWHGTANLVRSRGGQGQNTVDWNTHVQSKPGGHDDLNTTSLRLHEAVSGCCRRARHLLRGAAVGELVDGIASGLHVGELVRTFLSEVVESTNEADTSLALHDCLVTNVNRLHSRRTSTDRGLDWTGRGNQQHVDPRSHGVDERLLQDIVLKRLVEETVPMHTTESRSSSHTRADTITDFRDMHVLVELVWVRDTGGNERLCCRNQDEECNRVDLRNNIIGNTVSLGIPAGGDLTGDETIEPQSLRDPETRTLLHANSVLVTVWDLEYLNLIAVLAFELLSCFLRRLEGVKILFDDDLLKQLLLVGVISIEQLGFDKSDTGVFNDLLLVLALDVLIINGIAGLGVHPTRVGFALDGAIVVLDETHNPGHFDAALQRELAVSLHLPSSARVTPRSNFGKASNNNNLLEIHHALEVLVQRSKVLLPIRKVREVKLDVGAWLNHLLLVERLGVSTINNGVLQSGLLGDSSANITGLHDVFAKLSHDIVQVGDELQTTVQVCHDGFHLAEINDLRGHESKQVEGHFLLREGANTKLLNTFSHNVVGRHETSATSPTNDSATDGEVVAPVLRVPPVKQRLKSKLGLRVETIAAESAVVRRKGKHDLCRTGLETACRLLCLDTAQHADEVGQHDAVSQFGLGVDAINLAAILRDGSEGDDKAVLGVVNVVDEGLDILLASLVEGHNHQLRATGAVASVHSLVVLGDLPRETTRGDDDVGSTADKTLQNFRANRSSASASHECVLPSVADTVSGSVLQAVEVDVAQLLAVLPSIHRLLLQVEERNRLGLTLGFDHLLSKQARFGILLENVAFIHVQRTDHFTVQSLELQLRTLGHLVLRLNHLVEAAQIALNLGTVAVLGDLATISHLLNVMLQLAAALARNFLITEITTSIDGSVGSRWEVNILKDRVNGESIAAVVEQLRCQLLSKFVCLSTFCWAVVNVVLHELQEGWVGLVHKADTLADDFSIDNLEPAEDDVEVHGSRLERTERWLNAGRVEIAMLRSPQIQLGLQNFGRLLLVDEGLVTSTQIKLQVPREQFKLLLEKCPLVFGEGVNGLRVHHHAAATGGGTGSRSCRKTDAGS
ncbi:hypothetical protein VM1G_11569 [Cytospora mali]|uniref:Uncharacterized protein n=1 Tax=Cytospora mali TaxID=578113 RepID=A0A194VY58_CYTMA|nr:hypothetical protein VM1G_11569 [Valsa mali]